MSHSGQPSKEVIFEISRRKREERAERIIKNRSKRPTMKNEEWLKRARWWAESLREEYREEFEEQAPVLYQFLEEAENYWTRFTQVGAEYRYKGFGIYRNGEDEMIGMYFPMLRRFRLFGEGFKTSDESDAIAKLRSMAVNAIES